MTEDRSDCRSCHAPMLWALSIPRDSDKQMKRIPLDPEAVDPASNSGAVICITEDDGTLIAMGRTLFAEQYARDNGLDFPTARRMILKVGVWRNAHFATCTEADQHRVSS